MWRWWTWQRIPKTKKTSISCVHVKSYKFPYNFYQFLLGLGFGFPNFFIGATAKRQPVFSSSRWIAWAQLSAFKGGKFRETTQFYWRKTWFHTHIYHTFKKSYESTIALLFVFCFFLEMASGFMLQDCLYFSLEYFVLRPFTRPFWIEFLAAQMLPVSLSRSPQPLPWRPIGLLILLQSLETSVLKSCSDSIRWLHYYDL